MGEAHPNERLTPVIIGGKDLDGELAIRAKRWRQEVDAVLDPIDDQPPRLFPATFGGHLHVGGDTRVGEEPDQLASGHESI